MGEGQKEQRTCLLKQTGFPSSTAHEAINFFYFFFTSVVFCKYLQVATKKQSCLRQFALNYT